MRAVVVDPAATVSLGKFPYTTKVSEHLKHRDSELP